MMRFLYWIRSFFLRLAYPDLRLRCDDSGIGVCMCCQRSWQFVKPKDTFIEPEGFGIFPLCNVCWLSKSPTERWPYYKRLLDVWHINHSVRPETYNNVKKAVLDGG